MAAKISGAKTLCLMSFKWFNLLNWHNAELFAEGVLKYKKQFMKKAV